MPSAAGTWDMTVAMKYLTMTHLHILKISLTLQRCNECSYNMQYANSISSDNLSSLMDYYFHRRTAESVMMIWLIVVHALSVLQLAVPAEKTWYHVVHFANVTVWKLHYKTAEIHILNRRWSILTKIKYSILCWLII